MTQPLQPGAVPGPSPATTASLADSLLPTENVIGVTPGETDSSLTVSADGAAIYRLPLWVPPGRNGLQPELALQYDSRTGYGWLGASFTLTGLPVISRTKKNPNTDLVAEPIRFDDSDPFAIGPERMVLLNGVLGEDGSEYRTRHETYVKIVVRGSDKWGPQYFDLYQRDGRILTFSPSLNSGPRHVLLGSDSSGEPINLTESHLRLHWVLTRVVDRAGNTMDVRYAYFIYQTRSGMFRREQVPDRITYTGSTSPTADPRHQDLRSVRFYFGADPSTNPEQYTAGMPIGRGTLLQRIEMWGPDPAVPSLLRLYEMTYRRDSVTGRSLLATVRECDGWPTEPALAYQPRPRPPAGVRLGVAKAPLVFDWELGSRGFQRIETGIADFLTGPHPAGRLIAADFNEDGRDDLLYVNSSFKLAIQLANPSGSGFGLAAPNWNWWPDDKTFVYVDENGIFNRGIYYFSYAGNYTDVESIPIAVPPIPPVDPYGYTFRGVGVFEAADFCGDRMPCFLFSLAESGGHHLYRPRLNEGGWVPLDFDFPHRIIDVDGDGAMEIIAPFLDPERGSHDMSIYRLGDWIRDPLRWPPEKPRQCTLLPYAPYVFADLNGDGLPDAVNVGLDQFNRCSAWTQINTGNGFLPFVPGPRPVEQPQGDPLVDGQVESVAIRVMDLDGDGRQELLIRARPLAGGGQQGAPRLWVARWTGEGLEHSAVDLIGEGAAEPTPDEEELFQVLDVNGNGLDDFVMVAGGKLDLYLHQGKKPDMLVSITDSLGAVSSIRWEPLSNPEVYADTQQCSYPLRAVRSAHWVVAETSLDDTNGSVNHYTYGYEDGRANVLGLGFLGFLARSVTHPESGTVSRAVFNLDSCDGFYPLAGQPVEVETRTPLDGGVEYVHITQITYSISASHMIVSAYPQQIIEAEFEIRPDSEVAVGSLSTTQELDEYGNVVLRERSWSEGGRETYTAKYHQPVPEIWSVALVSATSLESRSADGETATRWARYQYDSRGLLASLSLQAPIAILGPTQPPPDPEWGAPLYITCDRNQYGLVSRVTESESPWPTSGDRYLQYDYDDVDGTFAVSVSNALAHQTWTVRHPGLGVPVVLQDPGGQASFLQYDRFGRIRARQESDGDARTWSYVAAWPPNAPGHAGNASACISSQSLSGEETLTLFDTLGRPSATRARDMKGRDVYKIIQYDRMGRVVQASGPFFLGQTPKVNEYDYDNLGRPVAERRTDGSAYRYSYDGRSVARADRSGNTRTWVSDEREAIIEVIEPGSPAASLSYGHGPFGTVRQILDPSGHATSIRYDWLGRVIAERDPDRGQSRYRYSGFGQLVEERWHDGSLTYTYDAIGRLAGISHAEGSTSFVWDTALNGTGKIATIGSADGTVISFIYDPLARVREQIWEIGRKAYRLVINYDAARRPSTLIYPGGSAMRPAPAIKFHYGNNGSLIGVSDAHSGRPYWQQDDADASGAFSSVTLGNGITETRVEHQGSRGLLGVIRIGNAKQHIVDLEYDYYPNCELKEIRDKINDTRDVFDYDPVGRLVNWDHTSRSGSSMANWTYRPDGRIAKSQAPPGAGLSSDYAYGGNNAGPHALTMTGGGRYSYDARGNQISGPGRTLIYDSLGLPAQLSTAQGTWIMQYDGLGRCVRKSGPAGERITIADLYEEDQYGRIKAFTVPGPSGPVAWIIRSEGGQLAEDRIFYLHKDHLGSIRAVTDDQGIEQISYSYAPFGIRELRGLRDPGAGLLPKLESAGFAGHEQEDSPPLIDMVGRWYDPLTGRFLSPDPLRRRRLYSGQENDPYAYAMNNPIRYRDPTGLQYVDDGWPGSPGWGGSSWIPTEIGWGSGGGTSGTHGGGSRGGSTGAPSQPGGYYDRDTWNRLEKAQDWMYSQIAPGGSTANYNGFGGIGLSAAPVDGPLLGNPPFIDMGVGHRPLGGTGSVTNVAPSASAGNARAWYSRLYNGTRSGLYDFEFAYGSVPGWKWGLGAGAATAVTGLSVMAVGLLTTPVIGAGRLLQAVTAIGGTARTGDILVNKAWGKSFEDVLAEELSSILPAAYRVLTQVPFRVPFGGGIRTLDVVVLNEIGEIIGAVEAKTGMARYDVFQRLADGWIMETQNFPIFLYRYPWSAGAWPFGF